MHTAVLIGVILSTLTCLLFVKGVVSIHSSSSQTGCYKTNVILNCPYYSQSNQGSSVILRWYLLDKSARNPPKRLVTMASKDSTSNRLILHNNGSLEISSFHPDDEGHYQCKVMQRGDRKTHVIKLSVACGKVTEIKREVCVEEDVLLECEAKHRTNPSNIKQVTWKKKTSLDNGSSYSLVNDNNIKLHGNGSLLLKKGRDESDVTYRCEVSKMDKSQADKHFVRVTNIKCIEETMKPATIKTTMGRVGMTTASPVKKIVIAMDTTTRRPLRTTVKETVKEVTDDVLSSPEPIVCGGDFSGVAGTFQSPNFPSAYPANSDCKWTISVPQGYAAINITLHHVNIEHEDSCQHDYIAIYDELDNKVGCSVCGTHNSPFSIQVKGTAAYVVFRSDGSVNKSGFKLNYMSVPPNVEKSVL